MFSEQSLRRHRGEADRATWPGAAFIVEALVLLAFLVAALAIFMSLFGSAHAIGAQSRDLEQAVLAAADVAERFAADPESVPDTTVSGDCLVICVVEEESTGAGTLYRADIDVVSQGETIYELETARYVSEVS